MKYINKNTLFASLGLLTFIGITLFYACKPDAGGSLGLPAKADFTIVNKDANNIILVNKSSSPSIPYWTLIESGANYSGDSAKLYFGYAGTYHIKQTIAYHGGLDTLTKVVTIASNDPNLCAGGTMQNFLSGCTQKTWRLLQGAGALGCGPSEATPTSWWASGASDVTGRACSFNDKYTFILGLNNNFKYDDGGDYFADAIGLNTSTCQDESTLTGTQTAWKSNTTDFSYQLLSGDASHPLGYLKVIGKGAHLGIEKVQNTGQSATPASSVTYNIADTTTVGGNKQMTLTIYSNDGVWWRMIISTN